MYNFIIHQYSKEAKVSQVQ